MAIGAALGGLVFKMKSLGVGKASAAVGKFQDKTAAMNKKISPQIQKLTANFKKFGLVAGGVFATLIASSPLLRARMEILAIRVGELVRIFGDALAPAIEFVTDLIVGLTDWFTSLDQPVQDAIVFGGTFVLVLGLLAIAFAALSAAMSPVTIVILALAAVAAILYLAWTTNFLGVRDLVMTVFAVIGAAFEGIVNVVKTAIGTVIGYVQAVIGVFEGMIEFVQAIFRGDLEGAMDAIKKIFSSAFEAIGFIIMWPINAFKSLIDGIMGGGFIDDIMKFGGAFINAFIQGIKDAAGAVWSIIEDILAFLGDFFGGSLPERGPLKHVVTWGQDFGKAYAKGIGSGVESSTHNINRSLKIDRLEMTVLGSTVEDSEQLFGHLNKKRATRSW